MYSPQRLLPTMRTAARNAGRWHRWIGLTAATFLCASAFPTTAGAASRQTLAAEQSVEFVAAVCDSPGNVQGNYEADVKPLDGVDPSAFAQPWLGENGAAVSGRLPAGCEPGGPGFVLEVARDTRHATGKIGLVTGADGRAASPLAELPHADRLAAGNEIWARPINADSSRYQAIAFRCGHDARNGDLNEYISGTHPGVQHCVGYYVRRPAPTAAAPRTIAPPTVGPTTVGPIATGVSPPTVAPTQPASSTTAPPTTAVAPPATTVPVTSAPTPVTKAAETSASAAPRTSLVPPTTEPALDPVAAGSRSDNVSGTPSTPGSSDGDSTSRTDAGSVTSPTTPDEREPSATTTTRLPTSGDGSASGTTSQGPSAPSAADVRPLTSAVPVTRPESSPPTISRSEADGVSGSGGSANTTGDGTASLSRPEPTNEQGGSEAATGATDTSDSEIALGAPGSRGVDLTLAIEVRGLTRPGGAESSPWTDTVRAEVICDGGPPKTLSLEPGENSGFQLSLGMKLSIDDAVSCTHRLIEDGLDDGSFGGVIASVDGQKTSRGDVQTVVLRPDDPARTLSYELIFVDASEANELTASGSTDLSRVGSGVAEKPVLGQDLPGARAPGRTGERIPAPTLVALGMMFIVGLALSIAQSSKAA